MRIKLYSFCISIFGLIVDFNVKVIIVYQFFSKDKNILFVKVCSLNILFVKNILFIKVCQTEFKAVDTEQLLEIFML